MSDNQQTITIARGDGIGPEIVEAILRIFDAASVPLNYDFIEVGEKAYLQGHTSGIPSSAWDSIRRNKVLLKGPITTPQGDGYKSLNVSIRKTLGLYSNVRPCVSYAPCIMTRHPNMNLTIIRENEEDLYAGIEHRQTDQVVQCLKLISYPGCERIIRYAFEYARLNNRRTVTCFVKDNIMKMTDGLFHKIFRLIAQEYPDIDNNHWIVDIGAARLADTPEIFDVIVMPNLYGDILSDVAAQLTGSVGLGGSANIGDHCAMFEAIHGSAPDIAGRNIANPSGLLLGSVMMLVHLHLPDHASLIHNAWLKTIEDGIHTPDIFKEGRDKQRATTTEFTDALIARLGERPQILPPVQYTKTSKPPRPEVVETMRRRSQKDLVGVDVFLDWTGGKPDELGDRLDSISGDDFDLVLITNRGVKVWPEGYPETFCTDHWRCRFRSATKSHVVTHEQIIALLTRIREAGFDFIKTEHLCNFDGKAGYSLGQGE